MSLDSVLTITRPPMMHVAQQEQEQGQFVNGNADLVPKHIHYFLYLSLKIHKINSFIFNILFKCVMTH
jgi:hypothetical protein